MQIRLTSDGFIARFLSAWLAIAALAFASTALGSDDTEATTDEESTEAKKLTEETVEPEEAEEAAEGEESEADETAEESESEGDMEQIIVTGSRLPEGDPAALVHSYNEEQINATGASNMEEFFRTLPWQFSSLTQQTSYIYDSGDDYGGYAAIDLATVNLRSLGSSNTLVLLNGRRIAGYAGRETDFVNILGIPMSAIERVEIQLDGGSAVYGADAVAGVVNFITKKNYRGMSGTFRQEASNTGADKVNGGITGGFHWRQGNITATFSKDESEPIINAKTGWNTRDYRELLGPEFDYRVYNTGQPGVVREWNGNLQYPGYDWLNPKTYQLPADHSGANATVEDFIVDETIPYDRIALENGAHLTRESLTLSLEHRIIESVRLFSDVLISQSDSYQRQEVTWGSVLVPATNAYNPFGRHMHVSYIPSYEHDHGLLPTPFRHSLSDARTYTVGTEWNFREEQELELTYTLSTSERTARNVQITFQRPRWDPSGRAFYDALSSSDPETALNFFGNGTAQGKSIQELIRETYRNEGYSETRTYNVLMSGKLIEVWGDSISYSLGANRRATTIYSNSRSTYGWEAPYEWSTENNIGVAQPTTRADAYFFEAAIPIIGSGNQGWWGTSLFVTIQNRYDVNWIWGSAGGTTIFSNIPYSEWPTREIEVWDPDTNDYVTIEVVRYPGREYNTNIVKSRQSKQSPRLGIRYKPLDSITMRYSWSRAFQLPLPSDLFSTLDDFESTYTFFDPYDPDGPTEVRVPYRYQFYNQDLQPEFSDTHSVSLQWRPEWMRDLLFDADWSTVDFQNRVESSSSLIYNYPEIAFKVPGIVDRNERGDAVQVNYKPINIAEKRNTIVDARISYRFKSSLLGTFEPELRYTRTLEDFKKITDDTEPLTLLGTQRTGDRYRGTLSLYWDRNNARANVYVYYKPGYLNEDAHRCRTNQVGIGRCAAFWDSIHLDVGSLTTVDANFTWRFESGVELQVGGRNVLNRGAPATIRNGVPYDPTRWDARGRVLSLNLRYSLD